PFSNRRAFFASAGSLAHASGGASTSPFRTGTSQEHRVSPGSPRRRPVARGAIVDARVLQVSGTALGGSLMHSCREFHSELVQTFLDADVRVCRGAIARDDFDALQAPMSPRLKAHLAGCPDCPNDVLWLFEIRDEVDVGAFP